MGGVQVINSGLYTSDSAEWATPQNFFDVLNDEFHFTLDPCSTDENAKCEKHYTKEQDGLKQDWNGEIVYCNPPYGSGIEAWVRKCYEHSRRGGGCHATSCTNGHGLVPQLCVWKSRNQICSGSVAVQQ